MKMVLGAVWVSSVASVLGHGGSRAGEKVHPRDLSLELAGRVDGLQEKPGVAIWSGIL